ncbi:MAG: WYL domain-containing protein [Spirochaetes bacterium]|nr:WYL domain-containing protein [Spirochaetota bacterium]
MKEASPPCGNRPLSRITFCALDLETNGTNPLFHEIIEVAAIRFTLDEGVTGLYHRLVRPSGVISAESTALHGITEEMVSDAGPIHESVRSLIRFIGESVLVIHNPGFDIAFLNRAAGSTLPLLRAVDTVVIARKAFPFLPNHKLGTICLHLGLSLEGHRALPDAYGCMEVFIASLRELDGSGTWSESDLSACCGPMLRASRKARGRHSRLKGGRYPAKRTGRVSIRYQGSSGEITERDIEPLEVVTSGSKRYIRAYCHLRHDMRFFRMDRIMGPLEVLLATISCKD